MYLSRNVTKPWCILYAGDPIEIVSARNKNAIIIKCMGEHLTVSQDEITDVKPVMIKKVEVNKKSKK